MKSTRLSQRIGACAKRTRNAFIAIVSLGQIVIAQQAGAATLSVSYLTIPGPYVSGSPSATTPANQIIQTGAPFTLPGYGSVQVSWTASPGFPYFAKSDYPPLYNQQTTASPDIYKWGIDTQYISMFSDSAADYSVTFTFLGGSAPDLSRLLLVVHGLGMVDQTVGADPTTATVSQAVQNVGRFPAINPAVNKYTAATAIDSSGTILTNAWKPSDADAATTDYFNTSWTLFKIVGVSALPGSPATLTVKYHKVAKDGIGLTLGYIQPEGGMLKVCKVGVSDGMTGIPFRFSDDLGINTFTVPAGPAPGGYCTVGPVAYPIGTRVRLGEDETPGYRVVDISGAPSARLVGKDIQRGTASVEIGPGITEITFRNDRLPTGYLEICKKGDVNGNFEFTVTGVRDKIVVPAGACSPAIQVPSGRVVISEVPQRGSDWSNDGCSTIPAARQGICDNAAHTSTVEIVGGDISTQTVAYITNRPTRFIPDPTTGAAGQPH